MKVIFKKTNEVKDVAPGYALNYLIPQRLAVIATEEEIKKLEGQELRTKELKEKRERENEKLAKILAGKKIAIETKTGKKGKLFGAVTKTKILKALKVDPKKVEVVLKKPLKKTGKYKIDLKIGGQRVSIDLLVKEG